MLLVGPPGTGKTLLARAVAGEAGVPFFSISGSEFVEMFVGVGASRVRDLFDQAKRNSPCIVFVDEIDAVGRQRGAGLGGSHDEREQTLNQILVEMDGFDTNTNVIVVAATNRPDVLDPALLRPGRFDRQVILDRPDMKGRLEILKVHSKGKPLDKAIDLQSVAKQSPGFSGADLANLVNEAAILAARRNKKVITTSEFNEALERVVAGPERKSRVISDAEKIIIAYHEGGHALVQRVLPKCDPVAKVSIISRGMALGYTMGLPLEDRYLQSKAEFEDKIAGMLGGNASERLIFGDTTTGSSNDIEKATNVARRMVTEFGMSDRMGPLALGKREEMVFLGRDIGEQRNYSDDVARQIDEEVRAIIDKAYARATDVLTTHKDRLIQLAEFLVAKETIETEEFDAMFADLPDPRKDAGSSGGITSLPLHQREEPPPPSRASRPSPTRHRSLPERQPPSADRPATRTRDPVRPAHPCRADRCPSHGETSPDDRPDRPARRVPGAHRRGAPRRLRRLPAHPVHRDPLGAPAGHGRRRAASWPTTWSAGAWSTSRSRRPAGTPWCTPTGCMPRALRRCWCTATTTSSRSTRSTCGCGRRSSHGSRTAASTPVAPRTTRARSISTCGRRVPGWRRRGGCPSTCATCSRARRSPARPTSMAGWRPTATGWRPTSRSSAIPASSRATCPPSRSGCGA